MRLIPFQVFDESMSAWRPRISKSGGLPNISFILRKSTDNSEVSSISAEQFSCRKRKYQYLVEKGASVVMHHGINNEEHPLCKFPRTKGKNGKVYRMARRCNQGNCKKQTVFFCVECGPKCNGLDSCFIKHVSEITKKRKRR